jgi:hypothetical protein
MLITAVFMPSLDKISPIFQDKKSLNDDKRVYSKNYTKTPPYH